MLKENAAVYQVAIETNFDRTYAEAAKYYDKIKYSNTSEKYLNKPGHLRPILGDFTSEKCSQISFTVMAEEIETILSGTICEWKLIRNNYEQIKSCLQNCSTPVPESDIRTKLVPIKESASKMNSNQKMNMEKVILKLIHSSPDILITLRTCFQYKYFAIVTENMCRF